MKYDELLKKKILKRHILYVVICGNLNLPTSELFTHLEIQDLNVTKHIVAIIWKAHTVNACKKLTSRENFFPLINDGGMHLY